MIRIRLSFIHTLLYVCIAVPGPLSNRAVAGSQAALDSVVLQLRWMHQFQFAGYYAAQEQGYFRQEGLAVSIREGRSTDLVADFVESNQAQYGASGTDVLYQRLNGKPLVVLASIFQHSAHALAVRRDSGIVGPADLIGRKVMWQKERESDLQAMLLREGVDPRRVNIISDKWSLDDFINGNVDAISCYVTTQEYTLRQRNIDYAIIHPLTYGVDFYGDCLFTSETELKEHPARVAAFRRASLKGWMYAMDHPDEIVDLILQRYGATHPELTREGLRFEADAMQKLIMPDLIEIGHMNPDRWAKIAQTFVEVGIARDASMMEGFIYEPAAAPDLRWVRFLFWGAGLIFAGAALVLLWNVRLRAMVRKRTSELVARNKDLRENEERLRTLINAMPDLVSFKDGEGRLIEANDYSLHLLGVDSTLYYGRNIAELETMHDGARKFVNEGALDDEATWSGATTTRKERVLDQPGGAHKVFDVIKVPLFNVDGSRKGLVTLGRDITERKRAEASLMETNALLVAIIDASPVAIVAMDMHENVTIWNKGAETTFGWKEDEVLGCHSPLVLSSWTANEEAVRTEEMQGVSLHNRVRRQRRKDGSEIDLLGSSAPLYDAHNNMTGVVGVFIDITERLRAQEQIQTSLLEKEVLLKEIHHRVKNNLQIISSLLNLQADRIRDDELKEVFRESQNRVKSMALIHERLYRSGDLARIDIGEYIRTLATSLFNSYRATVPNVELEICVQSKPLEIGISIPCGLLLNELMTNAVKYAFPDERSGKICVVLQEEVGGTYVLRVEDDGIGLPANVDPAVTETLGLSLVSVLVQQIQGSMCINRGRGTSFAITIPVKPPPSGPAA